MTDTRLLGQSLVFPLLRVSSPCPQGHTFLLQTFNKVIFLKMAILSLRRTLELFAVLAGEMEFSLLYFVVRELFFWFTTS